MKKFMETIKNLRNAFDTGLITSREYGRETFRANPTEPILALPQCRGMCDACPYTDECRGYEAGNPTGLVYNTELHVALCEGRHVCAGAVDGAIFPEVIPDPTGTEALELYASRRLQGCETLHLYVTGMSVALVAVLNAAKLLGIVVTLYHYDRNTGNYYPQHVV